MLCLTAVIWGTAFIAQKSGMDSVGACSFNTIRSFIGGLTLIPCICLLDWLGGRRLSLLGTSQRRPLVQGGVCCGLALGVASMLQQYGIASSSVGKAGFLTTLYMFIVPLMGLFLGRRIRGATWLCVAAAVFGMYLLCFKGDGNTLNRGDLLLILCAVVFSVHILLIDHFAPRTDPVRMSCIQFFVAGLVSLPAMLLWEKISWQNVLDGAIPLLYAGVLSSGVAYTLQVVGQKHVHPVVASLLLSMESVFAALGGWLILHERLSGRELLGCLIIFGAVVVVNCLGAGEEKKE